MTVITINIPDSANVDQKEAMIIFSAALHQKGKLSLGQAAELAGFTKRAFTELLGAYGYSIFNYPASDLADDVSNA